jgi:hypothetical protein
MAAIPGGPAGSAAGSERNIFVPSGLDIRLPGNVMPNAAARPPAGASLLPEITPPGAAPQHAAAATSGHDASMASIEKRHSILARNRGSGTSGTHKRATSAYPRAGAYLEQTQVSA